MSGKRKKLQLVTLYSKRRKGAPLEEINFDSEARQEFLTGFHKRKLQRQKHAQVEAAKKEREEKLRERQQIRDERRANVKARIDAVNAELRKQEAAIRGDEETGSESEPDDAKETSWDEPAIDHEDEYEDEDKFTTVTVEMVDVTREGMAKSAESHGKVVEAELDEEEPQLAFKVEAKKSENRGIERAKLPKKKKKKFRYESKADRQLAMAKVKARKAKAKARRKEAEE